MQIFYRSQAGLVGAGRSPGLDVDPLPTAKPVGPVPPFHPIFPVDP